MKQLFAILISLFCCHILLAQNSTLATLPALQLNTENGHNIIQWSSQYDGVKAIAIQRSPDSVFNFVTIETLSSPKKGIGRYADKSPMLGNNYYRLCVFFNGDLEWFSNTYKVVLDSATIAKSHEQSIKTGTTNSKPLNTTTKENTSTNNENDFYYTPSTKVFTNPYSGHVVISLNDAISQKYNLRFYDMKKNEVLKISRIMKPYLILDKNNFNAKGNFQFQLFNGTSLVETGYITIF
ncbi:MAG: hypothetical protein R2831_05980 [Chitinophagaceae bacterium]